MKNSFALTPFLSLLICACLFVSPGAFSAQLSPTTARSAIKAFDYQDNEEWEKAIAALSSAKMPTDYDKAYINRMLGVMYWHNNQPIKAITTLQTSVSLNALEPDAQHAAMRMLADLYMTREQYSNALSLYYSLTNEKEIASSDLAQIWLRIAQANYQQNGNRKALDAISAHLKLAKPTVGALSLKLGAELKLQKWKSSLSTSKSLIAMEPANKAWWLQRVSSYQKLDDQDGMLNTLVLAQRKGISLTESEEKLLAQLYANAGVPEKAAALLRDLNQTASDKTTLVMEASYWQQAKEWDDAIAAWKRAAHQDATYHWIVAQLEIQQGQYVDALKTLDAISDPKRRGDVEIARVRAYEKLGDFDTALLHAKRAMEFAPSASTESWIQYLTNKRSSQ
ncbi:hypothetical protein LRP49_07380 [Enterovibrio sp. ZSDZ35]|uniref:Tetratricopeptide repeat-containing protein n=1 Tax=Enterovibrio qingdaonensis TaxID=2899818 RepID=A0ABT5QK29_9GAMM|nr:hypothetical protein [Enterovibrio sp. ZSDZ35]MDD1781023.1 hypothetical protein [Enterovibrio sp. ZSDZ35]